MRHQRKKEKIRQAECAGQGKAEWVRGAENLSQRDWHPESRPVIQNMTVIGKGEKGGKKQNKE